MKVGSGYLRKAGHRVDLEHAFQRNLMFALPRQRYERLLGPYFRHGAAVAACSQSCSTPTHQTSPRAARAAKRFIADVAVPAWLPGCPAICRKFMGSCCNGSNFRSSIFPVRHDLYSIPGYQRFAHIWRGEGTGPLVELPLSTARILGVNIPVGC